MACSLLNITYLHHIGISYIIHISCLVVFFRKLLPCSVRSIYSLYLLFLFFARTITTSWVAAMCLYQNERIYLMYGITENDK